MRSSRLLCLLIGVLLTIPLCAESKNPADYPLRLHILTSSGTSFYRNRVTEEVKGDGRGTLFENSEPRGVDFSFDCPQKIKPSFGFETYPAKWKKKNAELLVLFPVFGRSNAYFACALKTQLKDYVYFMRNGQLDSQPAAQFKAWMLGHAYDPEHGKSTPVAASAMAAPSQLEQARQYLTGGHKDTNKATELLLEVAQDPKASPEELIWAQIYLGYIEDRAGNRKAAIGLYEKALKVEGAPSGSVSMAKYGLRQPLVWIRHLDAAAEMRGQTREP